MQRASHPGERPQNFLPVRVKTFLKTIRDYYIRHGRDLPWRRTRSPYRILVSEVMLQQTQVERVLQYYPRFLARFPDFEALARTPLVKILKAWQGLGYNRRALALKKIAAAVHEKYGGRLPRQPHLLTELPGIGNATAGAIAAFAFNNPSPFLETNIRRVFLHFFFARRRKVRDEEVMPFVGKTLDKKNPREWYYALMDYGAMLATQGVNPNRKSAGYRRQPLFKGSRRELRGKILTLFLREGALKVGDAVERLAVPPERIREVMSSLRREGFLTGA